MKRRFRAALFVLLAAALAPAGAWQEPAASPDAPQTTFRSGVNLVRVDVIATDRSGKPVTDLTVDDFEIIEDGRRQTIEQFRLIQVTGEQTSGAPLARELRTRDDELFDAERDDVGVFAILLDDYHVPQSRTQVVRDMLVDFVRTRVRPNDLLTVMYPLTPVTTLTFTRDHESVVQAIRLFEGRKGNHTPRNAVEEQHWRNLPAIERIRAEVVADALSALAVRLGSLREGRKAVIFVGDAVPAGLLRLRDVARDANRHNVSIYPVDPCGLMVGTGGFTQGGQRECTPGRNRVETLRYLAEETDGRAIVNRNTLAEGLAQIVRDASYYYLLGYTSDQAPTDGKFHEIQVRVKTRGVELRARKGYWALSEADVARAAAAKPIVLTPVQQALSSIDLAADARRYVRTWTGSARAADGTPRVTVTWELLARGDRQAWEQPGSVTLTAADESGRVHFSGGGPVTAVPQQVVFSAPAGRIDVRLSVESAATGETLDREVKSIQVAGADTPLALSTPRVFAARTAAEFRTAAADPAAVPLARREFRRTERLLIRFDAYAAGADAPTVAATLVNLHGDRVADVPVTPAQAGGTHQISLPLGGLALGEYAVQVTVTGSTGEVVELLPLRVGG